MYLAFVDESAHTETEQFTVCGLTAISADAVSEISDLVSEIRSACNLEAAQPLKWTLPENWNRDEHGEAYTLAKQRILKIFERVDVNFFGYVHLNHSAGVNDHKRNAQFGFNTLLGGFDRWLVEESQCAAVIFDRMDWSGAYDYCIEKFVTGLEFPSGKRSPLDRVISFSMASSRMSDLCSLNDVMTGAVRYIANSDRAERIRQTLVGNLYKALPKKADRSVNDYSFFMRPKSLKEHSSRRQQRYSDLKNFLNSSFSDK